VNRAGGRVAVFASGLGTDWSDLPRLPDFVPFCQDLVLYLARTDAGRLSAFEVGQHVPIRLDPSPWPTAVWVIPPGSSEKVPVLPGATPGRELFWRTSVPGYYRVELVRKDRQWAEGFAINSDPAQSDLRQVAADDVRA